jgi:hypothetical protein
MINVGVIKQVSDQADTYKATVILTTDQMLSNPALQFDTPQVYNQVYGTLGLNQDYIIIQIILFGIAQKQTIWEYTFMVKLAKKGAKLDSIKGPPGEKGPVGPQGEEGPVGPKGDKGDPGNIYGPAGGDLADEYPDPLVAGLQGRPFSDDAPDLYYTPLWLGAIWTPTKLTLDMIDPAFTASLSGTSALEVGQSIVTPAFTAAYPRTPDSVILTDTEGSPPKDVSSTPTAFSSDGTFVKNSYGGFVTFSIEATEYTFSKTASFTVSWLQRVYWDAADIPVGYDEAFIESLSNYAIASSRSRTFTVTAGATQHIHYCYRDAYGTGTFWVGGFEGGFELAATVSVENAYGFTENYRVYRSVQPNLGTTTVTVT